LKKNVLFVIESIKAKNYHMLAIDVQIMDKFVKLVLLTSLLKKKSYNFSHTTLCTDTDKIKLRDISSKLDELNYKKVIEYLNND